MPHDAIRQWKSTGKTCIFSEYLDLIAPAQEEYIRKCTDGLMESLDADLLRGSVQGIMIRKCRASPSLKKTARDPEDVPSLPKG